MPIDIEKWRSKIAWYRQKEAERDVNGGVAPLGAADDLVELLDAYVAARNEIEALRKEVEDQRLELCRYDDAWCKTDEERELRPRPR